MVGLLARFGLLGLAPPYDALASDIALAGLALLAATEIVGDKVPALDSLVHAVQWPVAAAAGAILLASHTSTLTWIDQGLAILVGLLTAGAVHGLRSAVRPLVTGSTAGLGNAVVSGAEDVASLILTALSLVAPILALVVVATMLVLAAFAARWAVRRATRWRRRLVGG